MAKRLLILLVGMLALAAVQDVGAQGVSNLDRSRVTVDHGDNPNGIGGIDSIRKNVNGPKVVSKTSTPPPPGGTGTRSSRP